MNVRGGCWDAVLAIIHNFFVTFPARWHTFDYTNEVHCEKSFVLRDKICSFVPEAEAAYLSEILHSEPTSHLPASRRIPWPEFLNQISQRKPCVGEILWPGFL